MTNRLLLAILMAMACAILLGTMLPVPAHARSKCQYFSDGREPLCSYTSDGAYEPYTDGRTQRNYEYRRRWIDYRRRYNEGARHTEDMASGGTKMGSILVSPYVPGSVQDKGWQAERKRRGLCGNDRLCLNQ
jgi:hypothetical protein